MRTELVPQWGGHVTPDGAQIRIWAPDETAPKVRIRGRDREMRAEGEGWFVLEAEDLRAGDDYLFVLDDGTTVPDPAARAQAGDVHGPSRLVDHAAYDWRCSTWQGRAWEEAVIYELHVGTYTEEGTFAALAERLPAIAEAGFTCVELMPVAQFAGTRGWGYDGVLLYAPHNAYGSPDDLKALIDRAHELGLMVLLDVVYNHFGPDGNYLNAYAPHFFHPERHTPWGGAIAYEKAPVRRFFLDNARFWLETYRFDGLRIDAADHVRDPDSETEILIELAREIRAAHPGKHIHLCTEDNRNVTYLHERGEGGETVLHTAEWNDDLHNAAHALATGEDEGYYYGFSDDPTAHVARALAEGFAFQGETALGETEPRGRASGHLPPQAFVDFLQNHDQIGNRAFGERLITLCPHGMHDALQAMLLLSPHIPLMFMGEEWGEEAPFYFFTDFEGELARLVRDGRRKEFEKFSAFRLHEHETDEVPDPNDPATRDRSRPDWARRGTAEGQAALKRVRRLLDVRAAQIVPHLAGTGPHCGTVLLAEANRIAVDWQLNGARLMMRANLTPRRAKLPAAEGTVIWPRDSAHPPELAPWQVVVAKA